MSQPDDPKPKTRRKRWMLGITIGLGILLGVPLIYAGISLTSAYNHYRSTQDFDSFVAARPVSDKTVERMLPSGKILDSGRTWELGIAPADDFDALRAAVGVSFTHGAEVLLETTIEIEALVDKDDWSRQSLRALLPQFRTSQGMRAIVQVGLLDVDKILGDGSTAAGQVIVDVLVVAGEGEDSFRVVELHGPPADIGPDRESYDALHNLTGLLHPAGELPQEGIIYRARAGIGLTWRKYDNGNQDLSFEAIRIHKNCQEYSSAIDVKLRGLINERQSLSTSSSWSQNQTWNGEVW